MKIFHWEAESLFDRVSGESLARNKVHFTQTDKGEAVDFVDRYANLRYNPGIPVDLDTPMSVVVNFKITNSVGKPQPLLSQPGGNYCISCSDAAFRPYFLFGGGYAIWYQPQPQVVDGRWHQFTIVFPNFRALDINNVKCYIDGVELIPSSVTSSSDAIITNLDLIGLTSSYYFDGMMTMVKTFDHVLSKQEVNKEYNYLQVSKRSLYKPKKKFLDETILVYEDFQYESLNEAIIPQDWIKGETGNFDVLEMSDTDPVLPHLTRFKKYIEGNGSAASMAFPNTHAYGTWEFDVQSGGSGIYIFYAADHNRPDTLSGYGFKIDVSEGVLIGRAISGGFFSTLFSATAGTVEANVWYGIKIVRRADNYHHVYIRGGDFGSAYKELVPTSFGDNPFLEATHTTSKFIVVQTFGLSKIANLKHYKTYE